METYPLYNGEVTLQYDPGKHLYFEGGEIVPGVTGVLDVINKPALVGWAAKMCSEYLVRELKPGQALDEIQIVELSNNMKRAHRIHKERAADIGTLAHLYIENMIKHKLGALERPKLPVNKEAGNAIHAFADWVAKNKVKWIASEAKVFSRRHRIAGTLDIDAEVNDERCIVDIKTSNGIWPEMRFQTAAYQACREEELGVKYGARWIVRIPKDGSGVEAKRYDNFDLDFTGFLGALMLHTSLHQINKEAA